MTNGNWKDEKMQFCIKYKSKFEHEVILKAVRAYNTGVFKNCSSERHCEKCPYSELFWSVFSRIRTEYG